MCTKKMRGRLQASGQVSYLLLCLTQTAYLILAQSGPVRLAAFHSSTISKCSQVYLFGLLMIWRLTNTVVQRVLAGPVRRHLKSDREL